jgi:hypothetical protein
VAAPESVSALSIERMLLVDFVERADMTTNPPDPPPLRWCVGRLELLGGAEGSPVPTDRPGDGLGDDTTLFP